LSGGTGIDLTPLFPNISLSTLLRARDLLNESNPDNLWSILNTTYTVSTSVVEALSKFDWDIFLPVSNEEEMEELSGDYQIQNELGITYIIGGIVFESGLSSNSSYLKNPTVKIRTNFSSVVDTSEYREK